MRLFTSLSLPAHAAEHLDLAVRSVEAAAPSSGHGRPALRWVAQEQRHITLAFYGEVASGAVEELSADLDAALAELQPFTVRLRGAGVFTGRTLWAGVQQVDPPAVAAAGPGSAALIELMRLTESTGARYARSPEPVATRDRRRAHVTLARARDRRKGEAQLRAISEALAVYEGPAWRVDQVHLVHSELGQGRSGGPLYTPLAELHLGG